MTAVEPDQHAEWVARLRPPPAFAALDEPVAGLGVGAVGKVGVLELDLARRDGRTRVAHRYARGPLCLLHPLYLDAGRPDMAFLYTIQLGEGLVQGDRYRLNLDCGPGTATHLTSQAATKIFRMERNYAAQLVDITAGENAVVEYLPDPIIPFRGSRLYQRVQAGVAESATLILGEVLLPGRVARGEQHAYDLVHCEVQVNRPDGTVVFTDRTSLAPPLSSPRSPGRLGRFGVLATLYIVSPRPPASAVADLLWDVIGHQEAVLGGVSELPGGAGVAVRLLGDSSVAVKGTLRDAWDRARMAVLGAPAPSLRRGG